MIVIIDYGVGNLKSVENMLHKAQAPVAISSDPAEIEKADKLILPGVGHFNHGMRMLRKSGLIDVLNRSALETRKPILGICLGSQIIGKGSEEGDEPGLGWIDMQCVRFPQSEGFRVPHMAWNELELKRPCSLFANMDDNSRYYFVHSYYMQCANDDDAVATTTYGVPFTSVVQRDNIFGTQFHPEKSLRFGRALLQSFHALESEQLVTS